MPRIARVAPAGVIQHVLNRGNGRMRLFRKPADYDAFAALLAEAQLRIPAVRLLGWCLMPNHWHLVLSPRAAGQLSAFMRWLCNTHVRRWRQHWHTVGQGHVYQGRFKNFPVQSDRHLLTVLRYVESNPLRAAGLVRRAQDWRWSSLRSACGIGDGSDGDGERAAHKRASNAMTPQDQALRQFPRLSEPPIPRPRGWLDLVNQPLPPDRLAALRQSVTRGRPFGDPAWTTRTATRLGLAFTLRPRGRPRKDEK
jgi:putative transposase